MITKHYHDLTDVEKFIVDTHWSWVNSKTDELNYKISQVNFWRSRAREKNIENLLLKKEN